MKKSIIYWILAIVITLAAAVYQRLTGPTYPVRTSVEIGGEEVRMRLPRSQENTSDAMIAIPAPEGVEGSVFYRRFPTEEPWIEEPMVREQDTLTAALPRQPAAGKLEYYVELRGPDGTVDIAKDKPVRIRFKSPVPFWVLHPHIFFMFLAMLISNLAGILALVGDKRFAFYTAIALGLLTVGGMILGPLVQWFAFGDAWTGVPFGWDLTDNKTLIAFLAYLAAFLGTRGGKRRWLTVVAAVVVLAVYSIPHSVLGSELDYSSGMIKQAGVN